MNILQWFRSKYSADRAVTDFDKEHYRKFEQAIVESDVEAYVYDVEDVTLRGQVIVLRGEDLHPVTVHNLVSFRKLNRRERRYLDNRYHKVVHEGGTRSGKTNKQNAKLARRSEDHSNHIHAP